MNKRDSKFEVDGCQYVIRNVPYETTDDGEEVIFLDISLLCSLMRDMMVDGTLSKDEDYETYEGIL